MESRAIGDAALLRLAVGKLDKLRIDVHPEPPRLEPLRRRQHDDPVARAEVHHEVVAADFAHAQHLVHHDLRGGHVRPAGALQLDVRGTGKPRERQRAEREHDSPPIFQNNLFHIFL